jgi:hypothetical protein
MPLTPEQREELLQVRRDYEHRCELIFEDTIGEFAVRHNVSEEEVEAWFYNV